MCHFLPITFIRFRRNVEKRSLLEHLDAAFLIVDELVDRGQVVSSNCKANESCYTKYRIIVETDPAIIMQRIAIKVKYWKIS